MNIGAQKLPGRFGSAFFMIKKNAMPSEVFWKNKKVFITGHTGFKGGWLSVWLSKLGANVTGYSLKPNTTPSFYDACMVGSVCNSIFGNILDYEQLKKSILETKPDIIIHMAAKALVLESYKFPLETYQTNLMGTVNILDIIRNCSSVKAFINVTSDKCYENVNKNYSYKETDPTGGYDPYSSSKGCSELITSAYRSSFFEKKQTSVASARSGNVIGGGDWSSDRLIPDFFKAISKNDSFYIRQPNSTRPWQHVFEPLRGYLILSENLFKNKGFSEAWNFGPIHNDPITVKQVLTELKLKWNKPVEIIYENEDEQLHEANFLSLDITKSSSKLGWKPLLGIEDTIAMTCDWYRQFYEGKNNMFQYSLDQINTYESLI